MEQNILGRDFEIRLLDQSYEDLRIVENYESCIWTERFSAYGDFQLKLPGTGTVTDLYHPGRYLTLSQSEKLMIIETTQTSFQSDGRELLEVSGKSYESVFQERVITNRRKYTGSPGQVATDLVRDICILGNSVDDQDVFPLLLTDTPSGSSLRIDADVRAEYLYNAVKEICDSANLGFEITYNPDRHNYPFIFKVIGGNDRTSSASSNPTVVLFSPETDNLNAARYIRSNENYKTVAYVWHEDRINPLVVTPINADANSSVRRRVLSVDASDIEDVTNAELRQRGREALAEHKYKELVDGQVDYSETFKYGTNYHLGDLVEVRYPNGNTVKSRVIEHIWSFDSSGVRTYPTLEYVEDL